MPRREKDAVRYVKESCSIYPLILRGDLTGRGSESIGILVFRTLLLLRGDLYLVVISKGVSNAPFVLSFTSELFLLLVALPILLFCV